MSNVSSMSFLRQNKTLTERQAVRTYIWKLNLWFIRSYPISNEQSEGERYFFQSTSFWFCKTVRVESVLEIYVEKAKRVVRKIHPEIKALQKKKADGAKCAEGMQDIRNDTALRHPGLLRIWIWSRISVMLKVDFKKPPEMSVRLWSPQQLIGSVMLQIYLL